MAQSRPSRSELFGDAGYLRSATFALLDFRVAVHSDDEELIELVELLFAATRVADPADHALALGPVPVDGRPGSFAALDGSVIVRTPARSIAFTNLVFEANRQAIECSPDAIRLHAAAVVTDGRAVVMPGAMGAGKSTLAAYLTRRGCEYVTDEVVAFVASTRSVRPYPRPLSLGEPPASLSVAWTPTSSARRYLGAGDLVPPSALGRSARGVTELGAVVLPRYLPGGETTVERLAPAEALGAVAAHAFHLDRPGTLARLAAVLDAIPVYRLTSGDLESAGDAVQTIMGAVVA